MFHRLSDPPAAQNDPVRTTEGEGPALDTLGPSASRIDENRDARPNADRETLLGYRIGGLYLGMPYTEAEKLLGKPKTASNSGPDLLPNGITRDSVSWNLSGTAARRNAPAAFCGSASPFPSVPQSGAGKCRGHRG